MKSRISSILMMAQSLKFFSYFGVRAMLVLYLIQGLCFHEVKAIALNAVFFGLIELSSVLGGIFADKIVGLKRAAQIGSLFFCLGFIGLIFPSFLFESLSLIVLGSSLFSSNIIALFAKTLPQEEDKQQRAFTTFYSFQNIGALTAVLLCSFIQMQWGFQVAFAVSSLGMVVACSLLLLYQKQLIMLEKGSGRKAPLFFGLFSGAIVVGSFALLHTSLTTLPFLPFVLLGLIVFCFLRLFLSRDFPYAQANKFTCYFCGLVLFYAMEDQMFSSLLLFTQKAVDRTFFGKLIPAAFMMSVNPVVIIIFGKKMGAMKVKHFTPFLFVALSFAVLALFCGLGLSLHFLLMMGIVTLISLAELMLGPLIYSFTSQLGKEKRGGELMGILSLGFSLAYISGGILSHGVAHLNHSMGMMGYSLGFAVIAGVALFGGFLLEIMIKRTAGASQVPVK